MEDGGLPEELHQLLEQADERLDRREDACGEN
jgi:hypothetical protein